MYILCLILLIQSLFFKKPHKHMEKEDNRKSSPEGLPSLSAIQILICILLLSDHRPLVTDLLLIDSVGYAELCVLTGADESIQNGSTIVALSKNVHPV